MSIVEIRSKEISQMTSLRIGRLRKNAGITLETLSKRTGFAKSYLSNIENCRREPTLRTIIRIANAFGVDAAFLISGIGSHLFNQRKDPVAEHAAN